MTITSTTSRWEAVGNGSTTVFPYNNKIFADTDLKVYLDGALQTLTTHYTVSGAGTDGGGNVTFLTAPATGVDVVIVRDVPNTQLIDYPAAGAFPSIATEDGLDKRTIISQQQATLFQRALRYLESDSNVPSAELPTLETLKGRYLRFSSSTGAPEAGVFETSSLVSGEFLWAGTAGGTANALTLSPTPPVPSYAAGLSLGFIPSTQNTGAVTVAVSGLAAKSVKFAGAALGAAQLDPVLPVRIVYDGTDFNVVSGIVDGTYRPRPVTAPAIVKNVGDWQRRNRDLLDFAPAATPTDWASTLQTAIDEVLAAGGELTIPTGSYNVSAVSVIDLQGSTGTPATNQRRIRIKGHGQGNTVLRATTDSQIIIRIVGDNPLTTASHGYMDILSNMSFAGNSPTPRTAVGVRVEDMAYLRFSSLGFHNLFTGFNGVGVLSSYFDFLNFNESTKGVVLDAGAAGPHSNLWVGCEFRQITGVGFDQFSRMSGQTFVNCRIEGCGTQGDAATGGMIFRMTGSAGETGPIFVGGYTEGNGGGFDISLQETASARVSASIMGLCFNRISSAKYATNNIVTTGDVDLNLVGCTFTSYNSYTPDAARPYLNLSAGTRVYGLDSCRWEDAVESPTYDTSVPFAGFVQGTLGTSVTGTLPRGWSVTSSLTGIFTVVHNIGHTDYAVNATAATTSSHVVERIVLNTNSFQVKTTNLSNTAVDADFTFQLQKLKP